LPTGLADGIDYRIRIESNEDPNIFDFGLNFAIETIRNITVIKPSQGDVVEHGNIVDIEWTSTGIDGPIYLVLYNENAPFNIAFDATNGSYTYTIPEEVGTGQQFVIVAASANYQLVFDSSDLFEVKEASCPDNLNIATQATADSNAEAESLIAANVPITNNATAVYHAGEEVLLTDGFLAGNNTTFRAYIEGCSGNFQSIQTKTDTEKKTK
jgi:hypothetical protein